jgi:hypothetical protein
MSEHILVQTEEENQGESELSEVAIENMDWARRRVLNAGAVERLRFIEN